jgi:hypothetical protein
MILNLSGDLSINLHTVKKGALRSPFSFLIAPKRFTAESDAEGEQRVTKCHRLQEKPLFLKENT